MKIAIVYDWIDKWGGVERLLLALHEQFPEADWYTSYYDGKNASWAHKLRIKTSFLQRLPSFIRKSRVLSLILYPYAFESFDLSGYDIVISVTSSFAKGVITKPSTTHICYMLTPSRYLWGMTNDYLSTWQLIIMAPILSNLRKWDYIAAQRPDIILTLSKHVAKRISHYYHRTSEILYPPFDINYWTEIKTKLKDRKSKSTPSTYYLLVSRLEPYKKVDLLIETFKKRKDTLIIIGKGTKKTDLVENAPKNINFMDTITDQELAYLYAHAKALILPQEEDFGYVSLEAQFFDCPIITFKESGVVETIDKDHSHRLVTNQSASAFQEELERFEAVAYNVDRRKRVNSTHFEKFSKSNFINTLLSKIHS